MSNQKPQLVFHGYNHPMLFSNIFDKHYLCISKLSFQFDTMKDSKHIYIGDNWKDMTFPDGEPLAVYDDFLEFRESVEKEHKTMRQFYDKHPEGIKLFVENKNSTPFVMYFLAQLESTFSLNEVQVGLLLKKTNERFWIWDKVNLGLTYELFKKFKAESLFTGKTTGLFAKEDILKLPTEYAFFLYKEGKITEETLLKKMDLVKEKMLQASVLRASREIIEAVVNDESILSEYKGLSGKIADIPTLIENDDFLRRFFVETQSTQATSWIKDNGKHIDNLLSIAKKCGLKLEDPLPIHEEFVALYDSMFGKEGSGFKKILTNREGVMFHELALFNEDRNKYNTTLINYLSLRPESQNNAPLA